MTPGQAMYSISVTLQRTITEYGFVSVPVTPDLIVQQPDGTGRLDAEKVMQRAVAMGRSPDVAWHPESQEVKPHPVQRPKPA